MVHAITKAEIRVEEQGMSSTNASMKTKVKSNKRVKRRELFPSFCITHLDCPCLLMNLLNLFINREAASDAKMIGNSYVQCGSERNNNNNKKIEL